MHINSHFTPAQFGNSSRPDHAANPSGRANQFEVAPADTVPTDTTTAVATTEETGETEGPSIPGKSVAHQARAFLASLTGLGGNNFGSLVSQIAQGTFDAPAYADPDGSTEETGEGEAATTSTETAAAVEEDTAASTGETSGETPDETAEAAVADLVDELLEDGEEDGEDDSEVT